MFYRGLKDFDSNDSGPYVVGETFIWVAVWCLLEAYVFDSAVTWLSNFVNKFTSLFAKLDWEIMYNIAQFSMNQSGS